MTGLDDRWLPRSKARKSGSHLTPRWRKTDSNPQSPPLKKDPPRRDVRAFQHFPSERDRGFSNPSCSAAESVSPHRPVRARRSHGCGSFSLRLGATACSKQALLTSPSSRDQSVYLSPSLGATQLGRKEMKISANMRTVSIISCIALLALSALSLFTAASRFQPYFSAASLVVALAADM